MPANRLARENSPYLRQHADNPVDWLPWGDEAFARARAENKPIFLSIGYSTCHWCHVMAHESFEDNATAEIMNRAFVNIKVDREERPDVDRVYMTFVQATTGGGGWPMSVWLTPELQPFVGGTYFPPEDRYGQPGFRKVLRHIAAAWENDSEKISAQGATIIAALREATAKTAAPGEVAAGAIDEAYQHFARTFDAHEGGFGGAPKFPRPSVFNFLTRAYSRSPDSDSGKHALEMVLGTLRKMSAGGIYDHIGGGFHRYAVDAFWHVPHFEKMLYDQAQLAHAYLDAFQITHASEFADTARDILLYVQRELTSPGGGFFSAEDADSTPAEGGAPLEGAFYVWTKTEIDASLGDDAEIFSSHFNVGAEGNIRAGSDPHGELTGKNVLFVRGSIADTAARFQRSENEVAQMLARAREKLHALRLQRPRPHLDDKVITAWNGLMISAFARAAAILEDESFQSSATRAADFIRENLYNEKTRTLSRSFREKAGGAGFADDYIFLIQGLLDLHETSFDLRFLTWATDLQEKLDQQFLDDAHGGYFTTDGRDPSVLLRMKEENDSAEPAASSIAALNLARLGALRNDETLSARARKTVAGFATQLAHFPSALPQMLVAVDFFGAGAQQIVLAGGRDDPRSHALLQEVRRHFLPHAIIIVGDDATKKLLGEMNPALREMVPIDGQPAAYVCRNFTCRAPVTTPAQLRAALAS